MTLTQKRMELLKALGQGDVIQHSEGFGTRMKARSYLMTKPFIGVDKTIHPHPFAKEPKEMKKSEFNFLLNNRFIERYFTDWSTSYWRISKKGYLALVLAEDNERRKGGKKK